ncbi:MAG: VRR-NUC domain-containing protein [Clostridiales bacterium]|nr:VRR-NUC domain-containing protein [Clostridiales bacterium]
MLERTLEKNVCIYIKKLGGLAYKFVSPGRDGVPDRICVMPDGKVLFIELKRPGEKPRPNQLKVHKDLQDRNQIVWVVDNLEDLKNKLKGLGYGV